MKNKLIRAIMLILCLSFIFSGCSLVNFFSAENLIRPPKLTGENAALQVAFENAVGKDIGLFTPIAGNHRASYILFDANADSVDEAVVFYSLNSNSSVIHMHLLSQKNGEWYSVFDITGSGTEVYKVDFYNIDQTNFLEIAVIWSVEDSKREKTLSVYRISSLDNTVDNALASMATIQIADYVYFDIDSDKANELLYLFYNSSEQMYSLSARLLDYNTTESAFIPLSDVSFKSNISSFSDILYEKSGNDLRIYLECVSPDNEMFTEMLIYSKEKEAMFIPASEDVELSVLTRRSNSVYCSDFNGDGLIDIPVVLQADDSYVITDSVVDNASPVLIDWISYSENSFYSIGKYYINDVDLFALKIDDFYENFFIVYDSINRITQVRIKNSADENNIVFSVSLNESDDGYGGILGEGFLGGRNDRNYNIIITALGEYLDITDTYVKSLIKDL